MKAILFATALALATAAGAATVKTVSIKKDAGVCEIEFAYPEFGEAEIDRQIAAWAKGLLADFESSCAEAEKDKRLLGPGGKYSAELNFDVRRNDAAFVSVAFEYYTYTGGAHPNTSQYGQTFLRPDGRRLYVAELVGLPGLKKLSDHAVRELKAQLADGGSDDEWIARGAGPSANNLEDFVLEKNGGMTLLFSPYQVAAYAAGPQEVEVPAAVLKPLMRKDLRAPQPSFPCAKAATRIERAICADWRLARADRQMAEDYAEMVELTYEQGEIEKLKTSQRAWLKMRNATCEKAPDAGSCLMPVIDARRKEIAAPRY